MLGSTYTVPVLFLHSISYPVMGLFPSNPIVHRSAMVLSFTSRISTFGGSGGSEDTWVIKSLWETSHFGRCINWQSGPKAWVMNISFLFSCSWIYYLRSTSFYLSCSVGIHQLKHGWWLKWASLVFPLHYSEYNVALNPCANFFRNIRQNFLIRLIKKVYSEFPRWPPIMLRLLPTR